ncbi:nuclear pore glycoprotein p62 isoform X1 [Phymastichus coffea]|uniref:nuclear pore glycoprotein p62 isoform X1 n=1 Tax=Phymastichus coffea TaxID=108790 RepID=UPI00273B3A90|nr:nuclear pore glycoprotein p62 isoform X1 [Phymastichus coffea]
MNFGVDPNKTQNTATPTTGISFGASSANTGGFSFGASAPATTSATGTALGGGYGPGAATSTTNSLTTTSMGFNMGAPITTASGFNLGSTAAATPSFNLSSVTTSTASGFNLGSTASPMGSGFTLGGTTPASTSSTLMMGKTTAAPSSTTTPASGVASGGPIAAVSSQPQTSLSTTTTVTTSSASRPTGAINFCQLEESINKWTLELEEQEKVFVNQATQINAWDRLLIANGEKIVTLNQEVERVKLEQQHLEHELDYVVGQQKELQDCLIPLEKELAQLSVTDPEREYTYRLAENVDTQLKQMSEDLKEIIEHLNEANRAQDSSDPIVQIVKILNAHMNSLQWLVQRSNLLNQKIQQIDHMHQSFKQENERSFRLAYN